MMIQRQIQESEMTDYQKQAVEKAKKNLLFDHTEICDLRFLSLGGWMKRLRRLVTKIIPKKNLLLNWVLA